MDDWSITIPLDWTLLLWAYGVYHVGFALVYHYGTVIKSAKAALKKSENSTVQWEIDHGEIIKWFPFMFICFPVVTVLYFPIVIVAKLINAFLGIGALVLTGKYIKPWKWWGPGKPEKQGIFFDVNIREKKS